LVTKLIAAGAKSFRNNLRNYNNALALSSVKVKQDHSVYGPRGTHVFRI